MPVSVLDASLSFVADRTQTDAAFDALPKQAERSFGEASAFATQFNAVLDATAENIAHAGAELPTLGQAFRTLRVTGPDHLKQGLDNARLAFQSLQEGGVTASGTLLQASIRVTEKQLAYTKAIGESTLAIEAELAALRAEYVALGGSAAAKEKASLATKEHATANELLATSFSGLTAALGSLIGVGFFVHFLDGIAKSIDEVDDLSKATGIAIPQIVGLKNAMTEAGDDSSKLGAQLGKVASGLVQAQAGSAEQRNAFKALGVTFDEVTGKAPPLLDSLLQISDHLKDTSASGDTLGLAYKALGKNSVELISFLGQGSAAIQEQIGHYAELGAEVEKSVDAGAEFQRLQTRLSATLKELSLPIFREIVDILRDSAAAIISARGELENFGREVLLQGQVLVDFAVGLDAFNKAAIRLDFSGMEKSFKGTTDKIKIDYQLAMLDMKETTKRTVDEAAKFLTELPSKLPKLQLETQEISDDNANKIVEQAKRGLDAQLASIEAWKTSVHLAFASGQADAAEWAAAQVRAADAADIAQERYLSNLISGFRQAGDVQKAQAATQELATLQIRNAAKETETLSAAIQKHNEFAQKMVKDWSDLQAQNVAKTWQDAAKAAQELVQAENRLGEAQKNLALANVSADFSERIRQIEELASVGIISEEEKAQRLREIYAQEGQDQLAALDVLARQQEDAVNVAQAKLDQARDNPFFTDAQLLNLEKNLDKALTDLTNTQTQIVSTQERNTNEIASLDNQVLRRATGSWRGYFDAIVHGSLTSGQAIHAMGRLVADGIGASVEAAVLGASSFGEAMQQMLKATLAALAGKAVVKALEELAEAFSALANPFTAGQAPGHFLAAAKWGAVGAAAAIFGAAVPSGRGNESSPGRPGNLPPVQQTPATTAQSNPTQSLNIPRFAMGALVSQPTLAILGDSRRGGSAREAVIPLDDPDVRRQMREDFGGGGGEVHNHYYPNLKGIVDAKGLMKIQSRAAKRGQGRLTATDSLRMTRRG